MAWTYTIKSVYPVPMQAQFLVNVEFSGPDAYNNTVTANRQYTFQGANPPTGESLQTMIQSDLDAYAATQNAINQLAPLVDTGGSTEPETFPKVMSWLSVQDQYLIQLKTDAKTAAITYLKTHAACTEQELFASFTTSALMDMAQILLPAYIANAYTAEYIAAQTFEAFRDFVVQTPVEQLLTL